MNTGKDFERFVHGYYCQISSNLGSEAKITLDEKVVGPDGERQCDIVIEHEHLGLNYRTLIECKDYSLRIPILHVDALASKLADLKFSKGVIVSRNGFQSGASEKAKRIGIDLLSFVEANATAHNLNMDTPFLHLAMTVSELSLVFDADPDFVPPLIRLTPEPSQERNIISFLATYLRPDPRLLDGKGYKRIIPNEELTLRTVTKPEAGNFLMLDHRLLNIEAYVTFKTRAYLGRLGEVSSLYIRRNLIANEDAAYIPPEAISKLDQDLAFFGDSGDVPRYLFEGGFVSFGIEVEKNMEQRGLFVLERSKEPFEFRYSGLTPPKGKWLSVFASSDIYGNCV
jgi:hypothetical protein